MSNYVHQLWERFRRVMLPAHLDPQAEKLLKRAFFYGARDVNAFHAKVSSGQMPPSPEDCQIYAATHTEIEDFANQEIVQVIAEKARRHHSN
jgi:hypothetical protein